MAELTRDEFASICGISRNAVNTYVGRGKIQVLPNKKIDTDVMLNKIFVKLKKQKLKKIEKPIIKQVLHSEEKTTIKRTGKTKSKTEKEAFIDNLSLRKLKADTFKAERDNELKQLQLEKMMGQLIPVNLVHGILKINIQNIFISFENELQNLASIYCDIMAGGDRSKLSEVIEIMRQNLHRIIKDTKNNSAKEIEGTVNEYAETRNRGERK